MLRAVERYNRNQRVRVALIARVPYVAAIVTGLVLLLPDVMGSTSVAAILPHREVQVAFCLSLIFGGLLAYFAAPREEMELEVAGLVAIAVPLLLHLICIGIYEPPTRYGVGGWLAAMLLFYAIRAWDLLDRIELKKKAP